MHTTEAKASSSAAPRFTARELHVAAWLGEDATYADIAVRLGISRETVRAHLRNLGRKLGVRSRHAIVARLHSAGVRITQSPDWSAR